MFKSILISIFLLFVFSNEPVGAIEPNHSIVNTKTIYQTSSYIPWSRSNSGYWYTYSTYSVYSDFDWMVTRSNKPDYYGYYYYHTWFYSQSFYWDGYNKKYTSTNIRNIKIYVNGSLTIYDTSDLGITFMNEYNATGLTFKSKIPNVKINIIWSSMTAK